MNITRENIDALNGVIRMTIQKSDYEAAVADSLKDYRKKASMPGFRPGKIPQGLIVKMYGKAALVDEVNKLISNNLTKFIRDEKLNILGEPLPNEEQQKAIDWDSDADFEFVFSVGFAPEIKVSIDKRSKYTYYLISVTDEMIDSQIKSYTGRYGENKAADAVTSTSNFRGRLSQVGSEDGIVVESALFSVDSLKSDEAKSTFLDKKVGDEIVFDIRKVFSDETDLAYILSKKKEEVADIKGDFSVVISEINEFVPAELNEELFNKVCGEAEVKDEAAFRAFVTSQLVETFKPSSDYKFTIDVRDSLLAKTKPEFPEDFLKRWLKMTNKELTDEQLDEGFDYFVKDLGWQLIRDNIEKDNNISVEQDDIMNEAKNSVIAQFRQYGMSNMPEDLIVNYAKEMMKKEEDFNRFSTMAHESKVIELIKSKATVEEKVVSKDDFEKLFK